MDRSAESVVHPSSQTSVFHRHILFLLMWWWFSCTFKLDTITSLDTFPTLTMPVSMSDIWMCLYVIKMQTCIHSLQKSMITFRWSVLKLEYILRWIVRRYFPGRNFKSPKLNELLKEMLRYIQADYWYIRVYWV